MKWQNPWFDARRQHHTSEGFRNLVQGEQAPGALKRWREERKASGLPLPPAEGYRAFLDKWWQPADFSLKEDAVWWLGHATLLLRLNGLNLLTDPVFSFRASPLPFVGPSRKTPVCAKISQLPQIDAVLISHNHYDHLDAGSIRQLRRYHPRAHYFVPLGLGQWFRRRGIDQVTELDWWQSRVWQGLVMTAVPAQHWSMRTPWNRNRTLWCGWVMENTVFRFWFSGDSGYIPELADIPARIGTLDGAALPVGAYAPEWFMHHHHMSPDESVRLWEQIGKPLSIPIHWGVFELADESLDEPPQKLLSLLSAKGEDAHYFHPLRIGQHRLLMKNKI